LVNGHLLSEEDVIIRKKMLELMCQNKTSLDSKLLNPDFVATAFSKLSAFELDGLVTIHENQIQVTNLGKSFIRNICAAIDTKLWDNKTAKRVNTFSKAI
jgi:oxygen-independent coproporphyrinogen-3 oxidase